MPYVRTVRTKSGARAVQTVYSSQRGPREIEQLGSAHDEAELEALKAAARQRMAAGQLELGPGLDEPAGGGPLPITSSRMGHLRKALERACRALGLDEPAHLTIVFAALAVSRWIEAHTSWSIRKFAKTARRYSTIQIQAGQHILTAADPIPDELRQALDAINQASRVVH